MRRCLMLTVLLILAAPHLAVAGTASIGQIRTDPKYGYEAALVVFSAAPGERNRIVVTRAGTDGSSRFVLRDEGAPMTAAGTCTAIDARTVSCEAGSVFVDAGDGDDVVTLPSSATGRSAYANGGEGADVMTGAGVLSGGPGNDVLTCPATACRLAGGAGDDALRGGADDDVLSGDGDGDAFPIGFTTRISESGPAGSDVIDGGPGRDQLTFEGRRSGVTVDLSAGAAGAGGERDRVAGIETVAGGDGDDLLVGDDANNVLEGDAGNDRIDGRGGNDYLLGNLVPETNEYALGFTPPDPGADTLRGGAGDDTLDAGSERGDVLSGGLGADTLQDGVGGIVRARMVRCGSGEDTIDFAPQGQLVSDCERLRLNGSYTEFRLRPQRRAGGRLRFEWTCGQRRGCTMAFGVRVRSSTLARRKVSTSEAGELAFLVRPRRAARRGDIVDVTVISPLGDGSAYAARWRVRV